MQTNRLKFFPLRQKFYRAIGADTLRFLQGMCTADLRRALLATDIHSQQGASCYGYCLNLKGKIIAPIHFYVLSENEIHFAVPSERGDFCFEALNKFIVADDVELTESKNWQSFRVLDSNSSPTSTSLEAKHSVPDAKDKVFQSPRQGEFIRLPLNEVSSQDEIWWSQSSQIPSGQLLTEAEWTQIRIEAGVPEWNADYNEESFLLEFPVETHISYHKGCYLGQEVVARATYRGHVNRAFCRFESEAEMMSDFIYSSLDPEKPIGKISSRQGTKGLGLIRVSALEDKAPLFQKRGEQLQLPLKVDKVLIHYGN